MVARSLGAVLTLSVSVLACGGGGSDAAPSAPCLSFSGSAATADNRVTCRDNGGGSCDLKTIEVRVDLPSYNSAFAAGFVAVYDPAAVRYEGYSIEGTFLARDGATVQVLEDRQDGRITFGLTRVGADTGAAAYEPSRLILLHFSRRMSSGTTPLALEDGALFSSSLPPEEIPGIFWYGGSFTVN